MGGHGTHGIAAVDIATGLATVWDPISGDGGVFALAVSGSTVYAGGTFTAFRGQPRSGIAALDASTGIATAWDPNGDGAVQALVASGTTIYVGGGFTSIGGQPRNRIAAVDASTGLAAAWNPDAGTGAVAALAVGGTTVYAGGYFTSIGDSPQSHLAAIGDITTPTLLSLVGAQATPNRVRLTWYAADGHTVGATVYRRTMSDDWNALGVISADGTGRIDYEDTDVLAGTRYCYRLGVLEGGYEVFLGETWVDVPRATEFTLAGLRPNPANKDLTIAFSLPDTSPARLEVLDIAGRYVVAREVGELGPGNHVLNLAKDRTLAPGVYLLRLTQGGHFLTARAVIVR